MNGMARRQLPKRIPSPSGRTQLDSAAYLLEAVTVLSEVDFGALDEAGKVGYAQALALVAIGSRAKHLNDLPEISRILTAYTGRA